MPKLLKTFAAQIALLCVFMSGTSAAQDAEPASAKNTDAPSVQADPALSDSELMPRASRSLLLDLAKFHDGYAAVGERGHILLSGDGEAWKQVSTPTRSTLTAIASRGNKLWAVGHDGVILFSDDGGKKWARRRAVPLTGLSDDPDDGAPLLDVLVLNDDHAIAIGAYSLMLVSRDGGLTWKKRKAIEPIVAAAGPVFEGDAADEWSFSEEDLALEAESDPHFNAIARAGSGALVIAGERGSFLRSRNAGVRWESKPLPYGGSMFGVLAWEADHILVFGLRGNVLESTDLGETWSDIETGITDSLMGGVALPGGGAILVGANGSVLYRPDGATPFKVSTFQTERGDTPVLTGSVALKDGRFLLVGDKGVDLYRNP